MAARGFSDKKERKEMRGAFAAFRAAWFLAQERIWLVLYLLSNNAAKQIRRRQWDLIFEWKTIVRFAWGK